MAITRNLCLDLLRRRTKVRTEELEPMKEVLPSDEASLEEGAIARQERQSLEEAMATLSAEDREVLALYYVQKRTTKEIAADPGLRARHHHGAAVPGPGEAPQEDDDGGAHMTPHPVS